MDFVAGAGSGSINPASKFKRPGIVLEMTHYESDIV